MGEIDLPLDAVGVLDENDTGLDAVAIVQHGKGHHPVERRQFGAERRLGADRSAPEEQLGARHVSRGKHMTVDLSGQFLRVAAVGNVYIVPDIDVLAQLAGRERDDVVHRAGRLAADEVDRLCFDVVAGKNVFAVHVRVRDIGHILDQLIYFGSYGVAIGLYEGIVRPPDSQFAGALQDRFEGRQRRVRAVQPGRGGGDVLLVLAGFGDLRFVSHGKSVTDGVFRGETVLFAGADLHLELAQSRMVLVENRQKRVRNPLIGNPHGIASFSDNTYIFLYINQIITRASR
ncbi:MAG: hypothetical protein BWY66_00698 [bacterium ADurb.Bin374]|nr:MAG: hypothetical protein BWY66_00698 [bacterium ADurb.Bin374]